MLETLSTATAKMRGQLGESLASIQSTPMQVGTTASLDALKLYNEGIDTQDASTEASSIPFFNRAIEIDPEFAAAYAALGMVYRDIGEEGKSNANFTKAFELRSRTTEVESLRISAFYYSYVTRELLKANEYYQIWADRYPHDSVPRANWAINCNALGEYEKAIREAGEAVRISPDGAAGYANLEGFYISTKQLQKAREVYEQALSRKLGEDGALQGNRYGLAFLENDHATINRLMQWASDKPGLNDLFLSLQSDSEAFYGHLNKARDYSDRAVQAALRSGQKESASLRLLNSAMREVEFGNPELAKTKVKRALDLATTPNMKILAAVILARAGDVTTASEFADELEKRYPVNTVLNGCWLSTIRASVELSRGSPEKAIEVLEAALPYELGTPDPTVGLGGLLYPAYLRGEAYLKLGRGKEATTEFQKVIEQWGILQNAPQGVVARLGLARSYALAAKEDKRTAEELSKAQAAYQDVFNRWKDADRDIPILMQASAEYAKLR